MDRYGGLKVMLKQSLSSLKVLKDIVLALVDRSTFVAVEVISVLKVEVVLN